MEGSKKSIILFIFFLLVGGTFLIYRGLQPVEEIYEQPTPEEIVEQYFVSWNDKNYADMYATLSDGFKKLEPSAVSLPAFKEYVDQQEVTDIVVKDVRELSNDDASATVHYKMLFTFGGKTAPFEGEFTLKNRQSDVIRGWKLIHPYGEYIDEA